MVLIFNENSRVKIPALIHLTRLGYTFLPKSERKYIHPETNIFQDVFKTSISKINKKAYTDKEIKAFITEISIQLENTDLGKVFYNSLLGEFDCKLIDFDNFDNNSFHVVTELVYKNGEDEFRPDITVLINGLPLIFIEVKKPNNKEGILAERDRINARFRNQKFKKFMNITQLIIFSNNNEYEEDPILPIQGAFYATPDFEEAKFNFFREEDLNVNKHVQPIDSNTEKEILKDTNLASIASTKEYATNKEIDTPTNRILTSLLCKERIKTLLKYSIAYVNLIKDHVGKIEKHIMRYPQFFATLAIEKKLNSGIKKGVIWHTQGSGKTALAYYNLHYLTDFYQKKNTIAKFYFITDRLDLATQAKDEFENRGLKVAMVSSKDDFIKNIKTPGAILGHSGKRIINVVNIQKFSEESISEVSDYNLQVQRIYFLDEVHRSYNPKGSFLANLISSDRKAVLLGLTGTPLILNDVKTKSIFGDYIHKYYYNQSIADGYTLRLIREGIETKFQNELKEILQRIETKKGSLTKNQLYAHTKFVEPLVSYISQDFKNSRILHNDPSMGAMIVCDSSLQAKMIFSELSLQKSLKSALILHDVDDKDIRKNNQKDFKDGKIDFLIVYNMLLTGFDASRLKKLYLARVVKEHNLLQTLTRVNRPYKQFRYGFIVDFADIREEFDKTNKAYFNELQLELGDEFKNYSNLFKSSEEIDSELKEIKEKLFLFDLTNLENFQKSISQIVDRKELLDLKRCVDNLKSLYSYIRLQGNKEFLSKFPFEVVNKLFSEISNRLEIVNLMSTIENKEDSANLLNIALKNIQFSFRKISENEMVIVDQFTAQLEKTRKELTKNADRKDPVYISLFEELRRLFKKKNIEELTALEMKDAVIKLKSIYRNAHALNVKDDQLSSKYEHDMKFARIHKRIKESKIGYLKSDILMHKILLSIKQKTDDRVLSNHDLIKNKDYFSDVTKRTIIEILEEEGIKDLGTVHFINDALINEYTEEMTV